MEKNLNPHNLEIGKIYWFRYLPCEGSNWYRAKITRFTDMGFPWQEALAGYCNGIVSGEYYDVKTEDVFPVNFKTFIRHEKEE